MFFRKSDINFLKASGATKKLKMQASMSVLYVVLIVVIVGILGGLFAKTLIESKNLDAEIAKIEAELKDPTNTKTLENYLAQKSVYDALRAENKTSQNIKKALEEKYKVPIDAVIVLQNILDEVSARVTNSAYTSEIKKLTFSSVNNTIIVEVVCGLPSGTSNDGLLEIIMDEYRKSVQGNKMFLKCEKNGNFVSAEKTFKVTVTMNS